MAILIFKVILRMNLLYLILCLVLDNHYSQYYFITLITFWFVVQYLFCFWPSQVRFAINKRNVDFVAEEGKVIPTIHVSQIVLQSISSAHKESWNLKLRKILTLPRFQLLSKFEIPEVTYIPPTSARLPRYSQRL